MAKGQLRIRVVGDTSDLKRKLGGATGLIGKFAAAGVAALAGAAVFSVKKFADFDKAMTSSLAIMGDVSDAMREDMSDAAQQVAKTTRFSATEAAESYFFLASAGLDAEQAIAALPRVAAFAQAGNFDMALATDLATDAQSALALTSDDAAKNLENLTRVTDVLVKANTLANASVEQFATSLTSKGGEAVRRLGLDIEEGVAILSVFADQGLKAEQAGTILARTLDGLAEQSRKNADAFEELGVRVFDGDGEMRNMADIVADLEVALGGMSTEQQNAALSQLGLNERAQRGLGLLLGNSEALREYEEELRDAGGTTDEVADKQLQNFWDQLGLLRDQVIDVARSFGESLMPALEGLVSWLQENMPVIKTNAEDLIGAIELLFTGTRTTGRESRREFGQHMEGIREDGQETKSWIELNLIPVIEELRGAWTRDLDGLLQDTSGFWANLIANTRLSLANLDGIWDSFSSLRETDWSGFWDAVGRTAKSGMELTNRTVFALFNEMTRIWGRGLGFAWNETVKWWQGTIAPFFRQLPGRVIGFINNLPSLMRREGRDIMFSLRGGLAERWTSVAGFVASLPGRIAGFFARLPGRMFSIGWSIVQGLWNGFSSRWSSFVGWVQSLPGAGIVRNIASALGIGSPSKVMAEQIGAPAVEGIEVGMASRFGDLERVAAQIPELMRAAEADARTSLMAAATTADTAPVTGGVAAGPAEVVVRLEVGSGGDAAAAEYVKALVRKGVIRLSANGTRVRVG